MRTLLSWSILLFLMLTALPARPVMAQLNRSSATISSALDSTSAHAGQTVQLAVVAVIKPGLHAQSHTPTESFYRAFTVSFTKNDAVDFSPIDYPAGETINYPLLGKLNVYLGTVIIKVPVTIKPDARPGRITIHGIVNLQACNDSSCFKPETPVFDAEIDVVPADQPTATNPAFAALVSHTGPATIPASTEPAPAARIIKPRHRPKPNTTRLFGADIATAGAPLALGAAFLIGIIFNAMPCVLPVLPLKIMGFYEVSQHDRKKSVIFGAVFSAGLLASFAVLGILIVVLKSGIEHSQHSFHWGDLFKMTWFNATISIVLLVMAIGTFGFFNVNVPNWLYAVSPRHDTYTGNFLFGVLTAALSTPCTFGLFTALLTWALAQPAWLGFLTLEMVGAGMAFPYFVLSAFPEVARKFPRTGPWAELVKQSMAFLLLGTAIFFADSILSRWISENLVWWLLFAVVAAASVYLTVRTFQLSKNILPRSIAVALALLLAGPSLFAVIRLTSNIWQPYTDTAFFAARSSGKPVLVDFTADWCGNCHYIELTVLHDPYVLETVRKKHLVMFKGDVTNGTEPAQKQLLKLDPLGTIPLTALWFPDDDQPVLLDGIYTAADLLAVLDDQ